MTAIVMGNDAVDQIPEVAQRIADLEGVSEVGAVAGEVDLIAFQATSKHDLEATYSLGSEQ